MNDCCYVIEVCLCNRCKLDKLYLLLEEHERNDYYRRTPADIALWAGAASLRYTAVHQPSEGTGWDA